MPREKQAIPWLEKDSAGVYYAHWYDAAAKRTKRFSLRTRRDDEAADRFAAFITQGKEIREPARVVGMTVAQVLDDYHAEHCAEHVIDKARQEGCIHNLKALLGGELLRDVDIPVCRMYMRHRRAGLPVPKGRGRRSDAVSDGTLRRELVVLQAAAKHALRWRRIEHKDLPSVELPKETRGEAPWLTLAQVRQAITEAPDERLRRFIRILYYTAARRASVETLTKAQIKLRDGRIDLRHPNESALKKRSKKRRPIVPIHPEIRSDIEKLLNETPTEFLFGDDRDMYRVYVEHMTSLGFDVTNPHAMRHSRATHLLQAGVSIYDVAKLLGDTVATVERVYGHHCPEYLGATIEEKSA